MFHRMLATASAALVLCASAVFAGTGAEGYFQIYNNTDDTGSCAQTFRVGWLGTDGGEVLDEPIDIDICEASNVYLDDNEIYYD